MCVSIIVFIITLVFFSIRKDSWFSQLKLKYNRIFSIPYLLIICICLISTSVGFAQDDQLCAVLNKKSQIAEMPLDTLKSIIKGEKTTWSDGQPIKLALMSPKTEGGKAIANVIFNSSADEMNKHYLVMIFEGKMEAPIFFDFEEDLIEYINTTINSVGMVNCVSTDKEVSSGLKIRTFPRKRIQ